MTLDEIRSAITLLSGSGKRLSTQRRHGIYSSFTLPGLDDMVAVRDTLRRFDDFRLSGVTDEEPRPLEGQSVLDLGANVGAMTFEFARRGATVTAVEYREDRAELIRQISAHFGLDVTVHVADFNAREADWSGWKSPHDYVLCSSVDEYISDLESFYDMLREVSQGGTLLLESNVQWNFDVLAVLECHGFSSRAYLGNGHSGGISRKRKLFRAS